MSDRLQAWLESTPPEPPVDPHIAIVDPHHHLWDRGGHRYMGKEFAHDLDSGHAFTATAYVECLNAWRDEGPEALRPAGESAFLAAALPHPLATRAGPVRAGAGLIAYADLSLGERVEAVLDAHDKAAPGRLRAIRYATAWHADERIRGHYATQAGMLAQPPVRAGIAALGARGLAFDVWAYFTQLDEVAAAADACAGTTFVLDHLGAPIGIGPYADRREEVFAQWRAALAPLAQRPNVVVKLGGLGMPLAGFAFHKRAAPPTSSQLALAWQDYVHCAVDLFGAGRCLFESNYPVDRTAGRYGTIWNAFQRIAAGASATEAAALFHATASQVYRI